MAMNSWTWVQFHHNADANNWYGDSAAWMRVALREDAESGRSAKKSGEHMDHHRLNVALVSAGISFELMYKVILMADRVETKATHSIRTLHEMLEARRKNVETILLGEGWPNLDAFFDFIDKDLNHAERKYWMSKPPRRGATGFMIANGLGTVPSLARMHRKLTALVDIRKLTEDYNLEYSRVVTTKALTANPIIGHKAIATKHLTRGGRKAEYTVYEATDKSWPVYDYVRGWWEMPNEGWWSIHREVRFLVETRGVRCLSRLLAKIAQ